MSLEIICPGCAAGLNVPDEARDAQAKCPHCTEIFDVKLALIGNAGEGMAETEYPSAQPAEAVPPTPPPTPPPASPWAKARDENPYAAPQSEVRQPVAGSGGVSAVPLPSHPGVVDAPTALELAWEIFKANMPVLLFSHLAFAGISMAVAIPRELAAENDAEGAAAFFHFIAIAIQWFLSIGLLKVTLGVARGQAADVGMLFQGGDQFFRFSMVSLLYGIMVFLGTLAFIVPGVYLALRFWPATYFVVDKDCGVSDAFALAGKFTEGNKLSLIYVFFLSIAVFLMGVIALCVGLVVAYPVVSMMWTIAYMMMARQPIQRPTVV